MYEKFKKCLSLWRDYIDVENSASYYIERDGSKLTIYFEWSNGVVDWMNNFNFPAKPYRKMDYLWFCHRGFLKVWKSIEPYIAPEILSLSTEKIDIVGYSHGGAIAQLCYEYVKFNRPDVEVTGVGYGSPRVFWGFARKSVKRRFEGFVVVRNSKDIVTHLPPVLFGFRHICKVVKIGSYSRGMIDDHREESYLESLADYEMIHTTKCEKCGVTKELNKTYDWETREGKCLCGKCVAEYDNYVKEFYQDL